MSVKLPSIGITFTQKAVSLIERSERGVAVLIVRDETATKPFYTFRSSGEIPEVDFSADNYRAILDVYAVKQPYRCCVVRINEDASISTAFSVIEANVATGWVTIAGGTATDFEALASWIGTCELNAKTYKAVVHGITVAPDKMHLVDFVNEKVTFLDDARGEVSGALYLPSLLGIFAASNVVSGVTYARCSNLKSVTAVADPNNAVATGKLILMNDVDGAYIGAGINSLTTTNGNTLTEDMKYIETVEAMDLIKDDIRDEFKNNYIGHYRNNYDNQMLFIAAVRHYFGQLEKQYILDGEYENTADINVPEQRAAWVGTGKSEAEDWTDDEVKRMAFKRSVYLHGAVKILGSMEHLNFDINMA